ncbi:MAG: hypothetical protein KKE23_02950 [Nanoarchaeota archaeon]|nr:hypothetical protein [Nanoarchaeota archaeon]
MAKKGMFKKFFSRMKKNAEKKKKNACGCGIICKCYRSTGVGCWGYGSVLAMILSYAKGSSLFWTLVHGLLSWFYIIYRLFIDLNFF